MCGFFGVLQNDSELNFPIKKHSSVMERRGPDDWGWLSLNEKNINSGRNETDPSGHVILAHQRLSILDLSEAGWQPMVSACERYIISYNGEVYNYIELSEELKKAGHTFTGHSDTEVILAAWKEWGIDAVKKFKGMFAFCIVDNELDKLYLARDTFGIKPAYYCKWDNGWGFGSTLNSLKMLPGVSKAKTPQKVYEYLRFGLSDRGSNTLYKDIKQVLPGTILEFDTQSREIVSEHKYWELTPKNNTQISFDDAVIKTRELFLDSVKLHMRSDVRIGAALSGGIDSSAIVCAMRHLEPELELHTFTFVSEIEKRSEEKWADIVNDHTNAIPHKIKPDQGALLKDMDHLLEAQEEPFGSTSIYAQYKIFKAVKDAGVKVILDGQGADEMLGGYLYYQGARIASLIQKGNLLGAWQFMKNSSALPERNFSLLIKMIGPYLIPKNIIPIARKLSGKSFFPKWLNKNWLRENDIKNTVGKIKLIPNSNYLTSHLADSLKGLAHLLRYEDRNSMYHSVESRVPFLMPELAEFFLSLPEKYLISDDGTSKYVFREAMRGIVPDVILDRQDKIGFESPQHIWLEQLKPNIASVIGQMPEDEVILFDEIEKSIQNMYSCDRMSDSNPIWRSFNFSEYQLLDQNQENQEKK